MISALHHFLLISVVCQQLFSSCFSEVRDHVDRFSNALIRKTRDTDNTDPLQSCRDGLPGLNGRDGRDGRDGACSCDSEIEGLKGEKGEPGIDGVSPTSAPPSSSTSQTVFVRWGRTVCPDTAQFLYEGLVGGTKYSEKGGGTNFLCLPLDPIYDQYDSANNDKRAFVYGAEYETSGANFGDYPSLNNHDVPCAVCLAPRGTLLNIPARNACPSGWVLEYSGYLMAAYWNEAAKEHICVDKAPETRDGSSSNLNGATLFFVEGRCGSLPCSPYIDGFELTCAVCTL